MVVIRKIRLFVALLALSCSQQSAFANDSLKCASQDLTWVASEKTLHIRNNAECFLGDLYKAFPDVGIVEPINEIENAWVLNANILLKDGARLNIYGSKAGGKTDLLRIASSPTEFFSIVAEWGHIEIRNTTITSWDASLKGPAEIYDDGRAYIKVRSILADDGTALESEMNILDSEVSYLGYGYPESYGLTWKVGGKDIFDRVNVYGDLRNSYIHHNYRGHYSYGAFGSVIDNNEIAFSDDYGLDPHDDSDELVITNNYIHHNAGHGVICSRRCNNIVIKNNTITHNSNGIMLHDLVVDSVVENNLVSDNRKAGIVVHDSHNNIIRNNRVLRNNRGMRITVGSFGNLFEGNLISENRDYSVFIYSGAHISSDDYSNIEINRSNISRHTDGRPRRNIFRNNRIINNSKGIFILTSEDNIFQDNTIEGNVDITVDQSQNILFSKNSFNGLANITVRGVEEQSSSVLLDAVTDAALSLDKYSNIQLLGRSQRIADFGQLSGLVNNVHPEKIILELGRSSDVLSGSLRRLPLSVKGQRPVSVRKIRWWQAHNILWHVFNNESSQEVLYTFSDLITESPYSFTKNGVTTYYLTDTSGTLKVKDVLEAGTAYSYQFQLIR